MQAFGRLLLQLGTKGVALYIASQARIEQGNGNAGRNGNYSDGDGGPAPVPSCPVRTHPRSIDVKTTEAKAIRRRY